MVNPKISIIIPVYNVENSVGECLDSVMAQDVNELVECIIVDDCGQDGSMNIVRDKVANYHGRIEFKIIVRDKNGGLSAARNIGIELARGEYVFFLDSDDMLPVDSLSNLYSSVKNHPGVEIVIGHTKLFPEERVDEFFNFSRFNVPEYTDDVELIRSWYLEIVHTAWNKLILRDYLIQNNLYFLPGIIHEDYHWHFKSYFSIHSIAFVSEDTYIYKENPNSIMARDSDERRLINEFKIVENLLSLNYAWDYRVKQYWLYFFVMAKMKALTFPRDNACSLFKHSLSALLRSKKFPLWQRFLLAYLKLPRPLYRGSVMIWILTHVFHLSCPPIYNFKSRTISQMFKR